MPRKTDAQKELLNWYMRRVRQIETKLKTEIRNYGYYENISRPLNEVAQEIMNDNQLGPYYYRANITQKIYNIGNNL